MEKIRGGSDASRLHQGQADGDGKPSEAHTCARCGGVKAGPKPLCQPCAVSLARKRASPVHRAAPGAGLLDNGWDDQ